MHRLTSTGKRPYEELPILQTYPQSIRLVVSPYAFPQGSTHQRARARRADIAEKLLTDRYPHWQKIAPQPESQEVRKHAIHFPLSLQDRYESLQITWMQLVIRVKTDKGGRASFPNACIAGSGYPSIGVPTDNTDTAVVHAVDDIPYDPMVG
jgi:hypothetical protein